MREARLDLFACRLRLPMQFYQPELHSWSTQSLLQFLVSVYGFYNKTHSLCIQYSNRRAYIIQYVPFSCFWKISLGRHERMIMLSIFNFNVYAKYEITGLSNHDFFDRLISVTTTSKVCCCQTVSGENLFLKLRN